MGVTPNNECESQNVIVNVAADDFQHFEAPGSNALNGEPPLDLCDAGGQANENVRVTVDDAKETGWCRSVLKCPPRTLSGLLSNYSLIIILSHFMKSVCRFHFYNLIHCTATYVYHIQTIKRFNSNSWLGGGGGGGGLRGFLKHIHDSVVCDA